MTSILKATAILGSGSVIALLMGLLTNKVYAVLLGPEGVGLLGLLQSLLGLAVLLAGMGLSSGLVRVGSPLVHSQEAVRLLALRQAAWQIYWIFAGGMAVLMLVLMQPLTQRFLAGSPTWTILPMVVALLFSLAAGVQIGLLNTHQRVGALARVTAFSTIIGSVVGIAFVGLWGSAALPLVVLVLPLAQWGVSRIFLNQLPQAKATVDLERVRLARADLLKFGLPFTASQLAGSAVQIGLPFLVLHQLGQDEVGYYKAAILFSSAYIGFLLNALGQDFFPRLSSLRANPKAFVAALDTQQRFVILLGSPLVGFALALAPLLVTVLFSKEFWPTVDILRWQLLGDLFKFVAWVGGFAVLAGSASRVYFIVELLGGLLLLGLSWWGMRVYGLEGLGIGFMLSYLAYLALLLVVLWRERGWQPTPGNTLLFMLAVGVMIGVRFAPAPLGFWLALSWTVVCGLLLWKQVAQTPVEVGNA